MNLKKSSHFSSNSLSIDLICNQNSKISENLISLISNNYKFSQQKNVKPLLQCKINFVNKKEFHELQTQTSIINTRLDESMLWSENLQEAYFMDEGVIKANPKNYITYPLYFTAHSNNVAFFHAACCKLDNKVFIIIGASKSGKSSLSYLMYKDGMEIAGDDLIFIRKDIDNYKFFSNPRVIKFRSETVYKTLKRSSDSEVNLEIFKINKPEIVLIFPEFINTEHETLEINKIEKKEAASLIIKNNLRISINKNELTNKHELFILKNSCDLANNSHSCISIRYSDSMLSKPKTIIKEIFNYC